MQKTFVQKLQLVIDSFTYFVAHDGRGNKQLEVEVQRFEAAMRMHYKDIERTTYDALREGEMTRESRLNILAQSRAELNKAISRLSEVLSCRYPIARAA